MTIIHQAIEKISYYIYTLFAENIILKLIFGSFFGFASLLFKDYETLIEVMLWLLLIDFILWIIKAIKFNTLSSCQIFDTVFKALVYVWVLYVWYAVHSLSWLWILIYIFSWIIILKDWISLLENLDKLWATKYFPFLWPVMQVLRENQKKLENQLLTSSWFSSFRYDVEFEIIRRDYFPLLDNKIYIKYYEIDIDWVESLVEKVFEYNQADTKEFIKWFEIIIMSETKELINNISKAPWQQVFKKYYIEEHLRCEKSLIDFVANYLKEIEILTKDHKNLIASKIIWSLKNWIIAWIKSDRNKKFQDYIIWIKK